MPVIGRMAKGPGRQEALVRDAPVRPLVGDRADDPRLLVGPAHGLDPGGGPQPGIGAVAGDREAGADAPAVREPGLDGAGRGLQRLDRSRRHEAERRQRRRPREQGRADGPVLHDETQAGPRPRSCGRSGGRAAHRCPRRGSPGSAGRRLRARARGRCRRAPAWSRGRWTRPARRTRHPSSLRAARPSTTTVSTPALPSATPRVSPTRPPPTMTTSLSIRSSGPAPMSRLAPAAPR